MRLDIMARSLTNHRLLVFACIAACYFLITLHITTNLSNSTCEGDDIVHLGTEDDKIIHAKAYKEETDVSEKAVPKDGGTNLAPIGKATVEGQMLRGNVEKVEKKYPPDLLSHRDLLDRDLATNMVYMIWCGRRWFEFNHYLSALSAIKHLRPDNFFFYYDAYPIRDNWIYNTWIEELKESYPFFHVEALSADSSACNGHGQPNLFFIKKLLTITGGIYINEHTVLLNYPHELRKKDFVYAMADDSLSGFISAKRGLPSNKPIKKLLQSATHITFKIRCLETSEYKAGTNAYCINMKDRIYPKDFWTADTDLAKAVRTLFYGGPEPLDAKPSYDELIPNIAHIVWIGGGKMDFFFYLGVLSLVYVAEVEMVYIHGNAPPSGPYWEKIKDNPRVQCVYRETPRTVYSTRVNIISHVTDVWRVDFMVRYGGIYVDTDTVFVKKLDREIRGYDAVGAYDWTYWNHPFPDTINFGVTIGKRNAKYWREFQKSMSWFIDNDWSWNGLRQPYRIKERHPELLKIEPRLQVICFELKCHPTWWPNYHNESIHHMNSPSIKDWKNDVYAFHWTLPTPPELDDELKLLTMHTMAAEVGRYILEKAGLLDELKEKYKNKFKKKIKKVI